MKAIYLRELRSYFTTIIGYLFIAAMTLLIGIYAYVLNFIQRYPTFQATLYNASFVYLLVIPILAMRSFAGERHGHTSNLLYTLPFRLSGVVIGKYLALLSVLAIPCLLLCLYPAVLSRFGAVEIHTALSSIFAFFLLGAALAAIGLFLSSLTSNQIVAAILIFVVSFLCYLMQDILYYLPTSAYASFLCFLIVILAAAFIFYILTKNSIAAAGFAVAGEVCLTLFYFFKPALFENAFPNMLEGLALFAKFDAFVSGLFDLQAVVYYLTVILLFLFFSVLSLEKRRWS